jgi:hypothetical protein
MNNGRKTMLLSALLCCSEDRFNSPPDEQDSSEGEAMAKEIVINVPQGSLLGKMTPVEIEKLVEQATAHLPKAQYAQFAEQVVVKTANSSSEPAGSVNPDIPIISWHRICFQ